MLARRDGADGSGKTGTGQMFGPAAGGRSVDKFSAFHPSGNFGRCSPCDCADFANNSGVPFAACLSAENLGPKGMIKSPDSSPAAAGLPSAVDQTRQHVAEMQLGTSRQAAGVVNGSKRRVLPLWPGKDLAVAG